MWCLLFLTILLTRCFQYSTCSRLERLQEKMNNCRHEFPCKSREYIYPSTSSRPWTPTSFDTGRQAEPKSFRALSTVQCRSFRSGVMRSGVRAAKMGQAVALRVDWSRLVRSLRLQPLRSSRPCCQHLHVSKWWAHHESMTDTHHVIIENDWHTFWLLP